ncbi:MAG: DUF1905 domain-containing protein [Chloroflexi bacterium]|nr:DUF1905 domain-containing protein [Chloroflexota bacterium]
MAAIHFAGPLVKRGNYYCVEFPRFLSSELKSRSRVKVQGTINGGDYNGSAFPTGDGRHFIMINARLRRKLDIEVGEEVVVILDRVPQEEGGRNDS